MRKIWLRGILAVALGLIAPLIGVLGESPITWAALGKTLTWGAILGSIVSGINALRSFLDQSITRYSEETEAAKISPCDEEKTPQ